MLERHLSVLLFCFCCCFFILHDSDKSYRIVIKMLKRSLTRTMLNFLDGAVSENSLQLLAVSFFCKTLHLRYKFYFNSNLFFFLIMVEIFRTAVLSKTCMWKASFHIKRISVKINIKITLALMVLPKWKLAIFFIKWKHGNCYIKINASFP